MVIIVGCIIVLGAVLTGFSMAGGHMAALVHLSEFITIGGSALGALIIMSPKKVLGDLFRGLLQVVKGTPYNRQTYVELFDLLYTLAKMVRRDGILALDAHVNNPEESPIFQKYPKITKNPHAMEFITNALSLLLEGKQNADELNAALEEEIKVMEREHHAAIAALQKTADALPGFGIVAAVLGIVVTMQAIDGPASEIGHKVGAALVGTFLGILLSYGFFAPLAGRMEVLGEAETTFYRSITAAVISINVGENARDVITRARRTVSTDCRPNQAEMKEIFSNAA
jgi:chemotaxis protein MotA